MKATELVQIGTEHFQRREYHLAEVCFRRAIEADRMCADAWHMLGMIADEARCPTDSIKHIRIAISLQPARADYLNNLGTVYKGLGDLGQAVAAFEGAIRLQPSYAIAYNNLGEVMKDLGRVSDSLACYQSACVASSNLIPARSNLLMGLNYDPELNQEVIYKEHRRWGKHFERSAGADPKVNHSTCHSRKIRIGYVSPDFRKHAVCRFFESIVRQHDRDRFDIFLYSASPIVDDVTRRLQSYAYEWRPSFGLPTDQHCSLIRSDQIDILIDLAGHTRGNRLDVFARKPAPIQVTYLGYPNTTGLTRIDYRITDGIIDPVTEPTWASEKIIRLPDHGFCFQPPEVAPAISLRKRSPSDAIVFGSHHPPIKLNHLVLKSWSEILRKLPQSRLILFRHTMYPSVESELRSRMEAVGLPVERVEFRRPSSDEASYLGNYQDIDIVLDAFPFNGHTMTCESLWMGVPVLTLRGDRPSGRLAASVLNCLGLNEWIGESTAHYVELAVKRSAEHENLHVLRSHLRSRMAPICDGPAHARRLEFVYRQMWEHWCAAQR